ncbi:two-partner secretion domain-containing protein [Acaryochloris marina]|uniref:two-partner secretion domain-containing protein n=1 Tax=Acaryochloris marina TaxID=155978 RepID=UPI00164FA043|nr:filamentous hemagglutinin N-terminal domain-containing protein [Acaryochloris marina]BDM78813.1 hypothetical protein AM10699_16820 [Acaryochloris marina MBIC10699]
MRKVSENLEALFSLRNVVIASIATSTFSFGLLHDIGLGEAQSISIDGSTPTNLTNCIDNCTISGGSLRGNNLFHSFSDFGVNSGSVATFIDPGVVNIFSRITGANKSNIDGLIRVSGGNGNLYILNPNGFVFGKNASLDLSGSFIASSANSVQFGNQGFLNIATNQISNLTINPSALIYDQAGKAINVNGAQLTVNDNQNLLLLGGEVNISNGASLGAFGGRIEIGGLDKPGAIRLNPNRGFSLQYVNGTSLSNISISDALLDVAAGNSIGGGSLRISANNINIENSNFFAGLLFLGESETRSGDIEFSATNDIKIINSSIENRLFENNQGFSGDIIINANNLLLDSSSVKADLDSGAQGSSGEIRIKTNSLNLSNQSLVSTNIFGIGNSEGISIFSNGGIFIESSSILSNLENNSQGVGGKISIQSKEISLSNQSLISTNLFGEGAVGNIGIVVDRASLNSSSIVSDVAQNGKGNGGEIFITVHDLSLVNNSFIGSSTFGEGNTGKISILAEDKVNLETSFILSNISAGGKGNSRTISVDTSKLILSNGAQIGSNVSASSNLFPGGNGKGGNIEIFASEIVHIFGVSKLVGPFEGFSSGLFTTTDEGAIGPAGKITVTTDIFRITDGASVSAQTFNASTGGDITINARIFEALRGGQLVTTTSSIGDAGNIRLNVSESILLSGDDPTFFVRKAKFPDIVQNEGSASGLFATSRPNSTGKAGSIIIDPQSFFISNGAQIAVNSQGNSPAGNVNLQAGNLTLDKGKILATSTSGQGGDINLDIDNFLFLTNGSQISATAGNQNTSGDGGNVTINTELLVALNNSDITANAFTGKGGNIQITTRGLFQSPDSNITASSESGVNGQVIINNPEVDPSESLSELPESVEPPQDIAKGCRPGQTLGDSNFVHVGRGGLPPGPHEAQTPSTVWKDLRANNLQPSYTTTVDTSPTPSAPEISKVGPDIVEAKGWSKDSQGRIYLTANVPQPVNSPQPIATC